MFRLAGIQKQAGLGKQNTRLRVGRDCSTAQLNGSGLGRLRLFFLADVELDLVVRPDVDGHATATG